MPMRRFLCVVVVSCAIAFTAQTAIGEPTIGIYTDQDLYLAGDTADVSLSASNDGEALDVDVYVGLLHPDGQIWAYSSGDWSSAVSPWLSGFQMPASFNLLPTPVLSFGIPETLVGEYQFAAVLTQAGTSDWASDASFAAFTVFAVPSSHYYVSVALGDDGNDGSEEAPWRSITHALEAIPGDEATGVTIYVAAGIYTKYDETFPLNMRTGVSLVGEGRDDTILYARYSGERVISCVGVEYASIQGFTITGGVVNGGGGGIYCEDSRLDVFDCRITGNSAGAGGGIYYDHQEASGYDCYLTVSDCIISYNSASGDGGAIRCRYGRVSITNNTIEANAAGRGGGISFDHGVGVVSGNVIRANSATGGGGGIYCYFGSSLISGNSICANDAWEGGGMCLWLTWTETSGNVIEGNRSAEGGGGMFCYSVNGYARCNVLRSNRAGSCGGGISASCFKFSRNLITENVAENDGGGIHCIEDYFSLYNNTIVNNAAGGVGGGMCGPRYGGDYGVVDSIIWNNGDDLYSCSASYCCIEDDDSGEGNIHDDPMFVTGPFGDYYLHPDSPCIDAGSKSAEEAGLSTWTTQTDGTPDTGRVDMGFHFPVQCDIPRDGRWRGNAASSQELGSDRQR